MSCHYVERKPGIDLIKLYLKKKKLLGFHSMANGSCLPVVGRCGQAEGEQRVVGGEDTLPGEIPFTVLVDRKRSLAGLIEVNVSPAGEP